MSSSVEMQVEGTDVMSLQTAGVDITGTLSVSSDLSVGGSFAAGTLESPAGQSLTLNGMTGPSSVVAVELCMLVC